MEVLATGEKIKRARVYKGLTLKEMCGEGLSISKLSCIENNKIKAEPEVLQYISKKLDIDYAYLIESTKTQLERNLKTLKNRKSVEDYEEALIYSLNFSLKSDYYNLAFEFIHLLFLYYLEIKASDKIQDITTTYYHICYKLGKDDYYLVYYSDMGKYLYMSKEYDQGIIYYNLSRNMIGEDINEKEMKLAEIIYNEILCYLSMKDFSSIDKLAFQLDALVDKIKDQDLLGKVYHVLAVVFVTIDEDKFKEYEVKTYQYYQGMEDKICKVMLDFAFAMIYMDLKDQGIEYIRRGLDLCYQCEESIRVKYIVNCIGRLMENHIFDLAEEFCDMALNYAIKSGNGKHIEKAYYYKAVLLEKKGKSEEAEMYMNLSLDALFKHGSKSEKINRYINVANMYYKLGGVKEALKYLTLAMRLEDTL
ncbi:MAG: helix-turn-helix transcriptional regulator [Clostridia bacterium]|jgi:transcriptional regulator with XRE-family HTH domain|nr:helix-turn-helix transcriptional regulator [Clostridia bacterium]